MGGAIFLENHRLPTRVTFGLSKGLAFIDANGTEMWRMPQFDGPVMTLADTDYVIDREDLAIPQYIFPYVTSVNITIVENSFSLTSRMAAMNGFGRGHYQRLT